MSSKMGLPGLYSGLKVIGELVEKSCEPGMYGHDAWLSLSQEIWRARAAEDSLEKEIEDLKAQLAKANRIDALEARIAAIESRLDATQ